MCPAPFHVVRQPDEKDPEGRVKIQTKKKKRGGGEEYEIHFYVEPIALIEQITAPQMPSTTDSDKSINSKSNIKPQYVGVGGVGGGWR